MPKAQTDRQAAAPAPPAAPAAALERLLAPVRDELAATEEQIAGFLRTEDPAIRPLLSHLGRYHGKLLRPALLHLVARAWTYPRDSLDVRRLAAVAAVAEMMHVTSLVHDDVLDESPMRRWQPTVNAAWGNRSAIMLGDFVFARAFDGLTGLGDLPVLERFALTARALCEGELVQSARRADPDLTEAEYLEIARRKTGELFAAAAWLGAALAGAPPAAAAGCERYGRQLGVAFQLADDCLDLVGEEDATGKALGADLEHGCLTLPLIHYLGSFAPEARAAALAALQNGAPRIDRRKAAARLAGTGSVAYSLERARDLARAAAEALPELAESPYRASLRGLTEYVVARRT